MRRVFAVFLALGLIPAAVGTDIAQEPPPGAAGPNSAPAAQTAASGLEGLDEFIAEQMKEWKVPGLAIAVVKDGKAIHVKGYGYRDVEAKLAVTTKTLFGIGSITKSFAAVTLGILVDEGKLDWDKPVREYMPDFRLHDPVAGERVTPRDLMSHRTGLPEHDFFMYHTGFTQKEMFERLRYLEPNKDLRTTFQYSNLMVMIAGYMAGQLTGMTWEDFARERVLLPLGMEGTDLSIHESRKSGDFALGYRRVDDKVSRISHVMLDFDAEGAAGAINSSAEDMSRYVLFHLNQGGHGEAQILSQRNAAEMQTPQIAWTRSVPGSLSHDEMGDLTYGLGLALTTYRGHKLVGHGGGFGGFVALMSFLPEEQIGIVVMTNLSPNPVGTILTYNICDRLLELERINWAKRYKDSAQTSAESDQDRHELATDKEIPGPSHDLKDYVGEYDHPGYGVLRVELGNDGLKVSNEAVSSALEHLYYDVFEFVPTPRWPDWKIKIGFGTNLQGEIDHIRSLLEPEVEEIVFTRATQEGGV